MIFTILEIEFIKEISDEFAKVNPISTVIKTLRDLKMNVKKHPLIQRIEKINIHIPSAFS